MPTLEPKDLLIVILIGMNLLQFILTRKMIDPKDLIIFIELLREQSKKTESKLDDSLLDMAEDLLNAQESVEKKDKTTTVTVTQVTDTSKSQMNG